MDPRTSDITQSRTLAREPPATSLPGHRIGPYRILKVLGEGGMGTVYLAEQTEPIRRRVALKLIQAGVAQREALRRFEAERKALALMNHPNIAQAFEAGTTGDGRPYFVMEYVAGLPITKFCDQRRLGIRYRLDLFIAVCEGVQHAHHKGIIHRDLKPSNVLVTEDRDRPMPKVIDFGIAKALDRPLTEETLFTGDRVIGTLPYMSPEAIHASEGGLGVDTRTDVYSLGILLYELLIGVLPFDVRGEGFVQIAQAVIQEQVPGLTKRFALLDDDARHIRAERRGTRPRALQARLKGDLEWISMKAIARDCSQRYQSAAELAADITRHMRHLPVIAGPPSTIYQIRKFVRRNKTAVASALFVLLALIAGLAGRTREAQRAEREAVRANVEAERANREAERANREAETARQVSEFLTDLFALADPSETRGNTITAREILDRGAEKIRGDLADQPLLRATLMDVIGSVYLELGLFEPAEKLLEEALTTRQDNLSEDHLEVASSRQALASLYRTQGRLAEAEPLLELALPIQEKTLGPDHPEVASSLNGLANVRFLQGRYDEAESLYRRSLSAQERTLGVDHLDVSRSLNNLAGLYAYQGRYQDAEPLYHRALEIRKTALHPNHSAIARSLGNLAFVYSEQGRYQKAEPLFQQSLAIQEKVQGPGHHEVAHNLVNIGELLWRQGRFDEAEPLLERSLSIYEKTFGPSYIEVAHVLHALAMLYSDQERYREAETASRRALAIRGDQLPAGHPDVQTTLASFAALLRSMGRDDEAAELAARLVARETSLDD